MDTRMAAAERRLRLDESVESSSEFVATWLRAGRRDPRRFPRIGDVVAVDRDTRCVLDPEFDAQEVSWPGMRFVYWAAPGAMAQSPVERMLALFAGRARFRGEMHLSSWRRWARRGRVVAISRTGA